ncbi:MAG: hypothetical protein IT160_14555, partial [Bryobacterales bacterium]|nr:hypothetical protein [Bryobacterales bacterium]
MSRRCVALLFSVVTMGAAPPELFNQFQDPPKQYSIRPFWFWNGRLDAKEVDRQIGEMVSQRVFGAYVHNRTGLQTPYLSDEYFSIVKSGFDSARRRGFMFGLVDEYEWPGGEARDPWSPGLGSRVIARNPEFRMRSLGYTIKDVEGPAKVDFSALKDFQFANAARLACDNCLDGATMIQVPAIWSAPAGRWRVTAFTLEPSQGIDGGLVDLMSHDAIRTWLDEVHEKYYKLVPNDFGTTIDSFFTDHEGDYGRRIAWTPLLFETFRKMKGYDLRPQLAALMFESGKITPKIRCDYMDVISELYTQSYMKQVADWCARHNVAIFGHLWEETLMAEAFRDGDLQRAMRAWTWPGVDSLYDLGRWPRDFKVAGSVAHFRGTRFAVENQAIQGSESYQDLQKLRLGTNMIAVWGPNLFVPCGFNYNATRIEYPHDIFFHQPYWKYFHHYADYTRRLAFMNDGGRHFADILLFQPTETA